MLTSSIPLMGMRTRTDASSVCIHRLCLPTSILIFMCLSRYCYNSVFGPVPGRSSRFEYDEDGDRLQDGDKTALLGSSGAYGAIGERTPLHG
jgi:hypothetical protein